MNEKKEICMVRTTNKEKGQIKGSIHGGSGGYCDGQRSQGMTAERGKSINGRNWDQHSNVPHLCVCVCVPSHLHSP